MPTFSPERQRLQLSRQCRGGPQQQPPSFDHDEPIAPFVAIVMGLQVSTKAVRSQVCISTLLSRRSYSIIESNKDTVFALCLGTASVLAKRCLQPKRQFYVQVSHILCNRHFAIKMLHQTIVVVFAHIRSVCMWHTTLSGMVQTRRTRGKVTASFVALVAL